MVVRVLYQSMEWNEIDIATRELVETTEEEVDGTDWCELGKYLAVMITEE